MTALFQRDDFPELIDATAEALAINSAIVEKDYYVTEALREIAKDFGPSIIFKGGTSLSKGWNLIHRFSEDIDIYIEAGDRGTKARNTLLKSVIATAAGHPAFHDESEKVGGIDGVARAARLHYRAHRGGDRVPTSVLLELGIQSGTFPTEVRPITSMLSQHLVSVGVAPVQEDCTPFKLNLLHFRRTFVEKMFALHDKVARGFIVEGKPIGSYARHYYDVSQLLQRDEVKAMLEGSEYAEIVRDYHRLSVSFFPAQVYPDGLDLTKSPAVFPTGRVKDALAADYSEQCEILCYGAYPGFEDILGMFEAVRPCLAAIA